MIVGEGDRATDENQVAEATRLGGGLLSVRESGGKGWKDEIEVWQAKI